MPTDWRHFAELPTTPSPALIVYPDRVRKNIQRMIALAGGAERLRPHIKTHKMPAVMRLLLSAGITRVKCATIAEAEMAAQSAMPDVLLAYAPVGPNVARMGKLIAAYPATRFSALVDDAGAAAALGEHLATRGNRLAVLVDLDVGMQRTGIAVGPAAFALYRAICQRPGLEPGGLHVYDGHIRQSDPAARTAAADEAFAPAARFIAELRAANLPVPRIVAGGTPTFPIHARHEDRECSPGTCVFWDASYAEKFADLDFLHAAWLLTRVVSKPAPDRLCLDLGYKAVSPDNADPRVVFPELPDAKMVNHSEEHLVVTTSRAGEFAVGDPLFGIPYHICPTVALHREALVVEHGWLTATWPVTARDRVLTI